jgi:regulator of nucleoside diphosphate kinase
MPAQIHPAKPPPVRVTQADYDRLADLAEALHSEGGALLRRELERARIVRDERRAAAPFVRLGSHVEYRDLLSGRTRRVELTLPAAADIDAGRLAVTSPVGAALIGLSAGDAFSWTGADGRPHALIVEWVGDPAAACPKVA